MKKVIFGILVLAIIAGATFLVTQNKSTSNWNHKFDLDEMSDQEGHGISIQGTTKYEGNYYFSFVCLGPERLTIFHDNKTDRLPESIKNNLRNSGVPIKYRIGGSPAVDSTWILSSDPRRQESVIGPLTRNTVETQNRELIVNLMNGLARNEILLIEYDGDISKIEADKTFIDIYTQAKEGCGFK